MKYYNAQGQEVVPPYVGWSHHQRLELDPAKLTDSQRNILDRMARTEASGARESRANFDARSFDVLVRKGYLTEGSRVVRDPEYCLTHKGWIVAYRILLGTQRGT